MTFSDSPLAKKAQVLVVEYLWVLPAVSLDDSMFGGLAVTHQQF
jgi:hypothetical protein